MLKIKHLFSVNERLLLNLIIAFSFCYYLDSKGGREMERIANRIVNYLDTDKTTWNDVDRMRMSLGLQVIIHNIVMIGTILIVSKIAGIFLEAIILLTAYGALKMTAGGVHFQKSLACLVGTGIFVLAGVLVSRQLNMELLHIILIYLVCLIVLAKIGPQGTKNNPISKENYEKLRKRTVFFVLAYLTITVATAKCIGNIQYLLLVAVVFETISLLPSYIKNRSI